MTGSDGAFQLGDCVLNAVFKTSEGNLKLVKRAPVAMAQL